MPVINLKGNSTNFTDSSVFTGLGKYYYICGKSSLKCFVAQKDAA